MRLNRITLVYAGLGIPFAAIVLAVAFGGSAPLLSRASEPPLAGSPPDVQGDVDAMNATLRRSQEEFEKSMRRPRPTDDQIASFQAEADKACVCTDRSGTQAEASCWAKYKVMTKPFRPEELTAACMFRTTVVDMFPGNKWVSLNQCTADREAAKLAKAAGGQPDEC
jgi:hypothetical protein